MKRQCGYLFLGKRLQVTSAWYLVFTINAQAFKLIEHGLCVAHSSNSAISEHRLSFSQGQKEYTLDLLFWNFLQPISHHRTGTGWRMQKAWETLQYRAGCCHKNNASKPQPEEPSGRKAACVHLSELFWWQQLIPSCSLDGDCFDLVSCRQEMWVSRESAYGSRFVAYRNTDDKEKGWTPWAYAHHLAGCRCKTQLNCIVLANYGFLLKNICR